MERAFLGAGDGDFQGGADLAHAHVAQPAESRYQPGLTHRVDRVQVDR